VADQFDRLKSTLADRYTIERELGSGGMATVYLAEDLRHHRKVALKVLRPELAAILGADRFLKEIEVTANLQHPHILPLFDSGAADSFLYYVMPFVEGESLRDLLQRDRQLATDDAVRIATTVAQALDYAHRAGVIHRDIKPENILLQDGEPVIADFGIALAVTQAGGARLTETGLSLGTPAYMSPEQATGDRNLDGRTDIYSLASVTYEMLAGDPPFAGNNVQAVIAKAISEEPTGITNIRPSVPRAVDTTLRKALAKVPADRYATAADFAKALVSEAPPSVAAGGKRRGWVLAGLAATAVVIVLSALKMMGSRDAEPTLVELTTRQVTDYLGREYAPSWSPDGSMMTFGYTAEGHMDVYVMATSGGNPIRLTDHPGDDVTPRWSPTGDYIAFIGNRNGLRVYIVPPTGGQVREVADTRAGLLDDPFVWLRGLGSEAWSPDGTRLLFPRRDSTGSISTWRVDVNTGETERVTSAPAGGMDLGASWTPDGRSILFDRGTWARTDLWRLAADGNGSPTRLTDDGAFDFNPSQMPDGNIAFISNRSGGGTLNVWQLNPRTGDVQPLTSGLTAVYALAAGPTGEIAYGEAGHITDLYWSNGSDDVEAHVNLTRTTTDDYGARVSPDGTKIVYQSGPLGGLDTDIWVYDRTVGQAGRLMQTGSLDNMPDWLPNGDVVFSSTSAETGQQSLRVVTPGEVERRPFATGVSVADCDIPFCRRGPNVSPDGEAVGFLADGPLGLTLWTAKPDGTDPRATALPPVRAFDWYGDSKRVVYTRRSPETGLELRAAHLETGEDILLLATPVVEPEVRPDGAAVAVLRGDSHYNMNVFLLRLAPPADEMRLPRPIGTPEPLVDGKGVWHVHNFGWDPTGNGFVYTRDEDDGDIWVLERAAR
jgi:serine/threonine-protein kinase